MNYEQIHLRSWFVQMNHSESIMIHPQTHSPVIHVNQSAVLDSFTIIVIVTSNYWDFLRRIKESLMELMVNLLPTVIPNEEIWEEGMKEHLCLIKDGVSLTPSVRTWAEWDYRCERRWRAREWCWKTWSSKSRGPHETSSDAGDDLRHQRESTFNISTNTRACAAMLDTWPDHHDVFNSVLQVTPVM